MEPTCECGRHTEDWDVREIQDICEYFEEPEYFDEDALWEQHLDHKAWQRSLSEPEWAL